MTTVLITGQMRGCFIGHFVICMDRQKQLSDKPMPAEPGEYMFVLKGRIGVIIIAKRHGILGGRGYLIGDTEAEKHCRNPEKWR
jgi:hypothetical protein